MPSRIPMLKPHVLFGQLRIESFPVNNGFFFIRQPWVIIVPIPQMLVMYRKGPVPINSDDYSSAQSILFHWIGHIYIIWLACIWGIQIISRADAVCNCFLPKIRFLHIFMWPYGSCIFDYIIHLGVLRIRSTWYHSVLYLLSVPFCNLNSVKWYHFSENIVLQHEYVPHHKISTIVFTRSPAFEWVKFHL